MAVDGTPCEDLVPPVGQCSIGNDLETLQFRITNDQCIESSNNQSDDFVCTEGTTPIPAEGSTVTVTCSSDGSVVSQETSTVGGTITVQDSAGGLLPDMMTCVITDENDDELQSLTINTSGDVDLYLQDKFGALQLESCKVENEEEQVCIVPITYTYTLDNVGTNDMNITVLEYTRDGETVDLLSEVVDSNPLSPGDSVSTSDEEMLNICVDGIYTTTVTAEADPPEGAPCFDEDEFVFEVVNTCRVDVSDQSVILSFVIDEGKSDICD